MESSHRIDLHIACIQPLHELLQNLQVHFALSLPLLLHFRQDWSEVLPFKSRILRISCKLGLLR